MHKSAGLLLGKISISCENKFFDIIIICALKGEYRHFRHCLAGSLFWKISGKASTCHNAQSQSLKMYEMQYADHSGSFLGYGRGKTYNNVNSTVNITS